MTVSRLAGWICLCAFAAVAAAGATSEPSAASNQPYQYRFLNEPLEQALELIARNEGWKLQMVDPVPVAVTASSFDLSGAKMVQGLADAYNFAYSIESGVLRVRSQVEQVYDLSGLSDEARVSLEGSLRKIIDTSGAYAALAIDGGGGKLRLRASPRGQQLAAAYIEAFRKQMDRFKKTVRFVVHNAQTGRDQEAILELRREGPTTWRSPDYRVREYIVPGSDNRPVKRAYWFGTQIVAWPATVDTVSVEVNSQTLLSEKKAGQCTLPIKTSCAFNADVQDGVTCGDGATTTITAYFVR